MMKMKMVFNTTDVETAVFSKKMQVREVNSKIKDLEIGVERLKNNFFFSGDEAKNRKELSRVKSRIKKLQKELAPLEEELQELYAMKVEGTNTTRFYGERFTVTEDKVVIDLKNGKTWTAEYFPVKDMKGEDAPLLMASEPLSKRQFEKIRSMMKEVHGLV